MLVRFTICILLLVSFRLLPFEHARAEDDFLTRAIPLAQRSQRETGVPASVTLAQAVWETGRGEHTINGANNYFGIKAGGTSDTNVTIGPIASGWVWAWTKEWNGSRYVDRRERFRKYSTMEDSFRDHALLLATSPRYAAAMNSVDDPREFARRIAAAGYATSPSYAPELIRLMDAENLYQYDLPRNAVQIIGHSEPVQVLAGDIFQIYFDTKNAGFGTWSPAADYYLASVNNNRFGASARQELDRLVPPEGVTRWAITMIAPDEAGTYTTIWRLKHGARNFGEEMRVQVRVRPAPMPQPQAWLLTGGGFLFVSLVSGGIVFWIYHRERQQKTLRVQRRAEF
jgi:hypothetical protein